MDNSEGKSHDTIPYMIINLDYEDPVYIGKETPQHISRMSMSHASYLKVNEICEPVQGINWCPPSKRKIVKSDLVYSPAQVTKHHKVELKDQDV